MKQQLKLKNEILTRLDSFQQEIAPKFSRIDETLKVERQPSIKQGTVTIKELDQPSTYEMCSNKLHPTTKEIELQIGMTFLIILRSYEKLPRYICSIKAILTIPNMPSSNLAANFVGKEPLQLQSFNSIHNYFMIVFLYDCDVNMKS